MGRIQDAVHDMMRESECGYGKTAPGLQQELGLSIEQVRAIERHVEDLVFMWHGFGERDAERRILKPSRLTELEAENASLRSMLAGTAEWRDKYRAELSALRAAQPLTRAIELLHAFADHEDRPCSFDHHGYCQEHDDFSGDGCAIAKARALLDSLADKGNNE